MVFGGMVVSSDEYCRRSYAEAELNCLARRADIRVEVRFPTNQYKVGTQFAKYQTLFRLTLPT